ncbi:MAG: methionyl-tRNA formyltransferase [Bacteroidetes bacterium]|nr:methionyl-tRNA formyltransferase [Bacteroidota bacterium]
MKIVFMGTPDFAIPSLKKLLFLRNPFGKSKHMIAAVVSAPDKERGRGREVSFTPVKEFALQNKLEVLTPVSLKEQQFINRLNELSPDLFVVVAFRILPKEVYSIPKRGSFNLHGSLLPKYRGAAPIQWALINGETETGVTTFFLEDKVDTGNIILQKKIEIDAADDFGSLHDKLKILGADAVLETVELIANGSYRLAKQNDQDASPAPKITKEICCIDWNRSATEIHNLVRGLSPYPGAFFTHQEKIYKVFKTCVIENAEPVSRQARLRIENSKFAIIDSQLHLKIYQSKKEIFITTGNGTLQILELQPEGRKRMTAEEFLRGYSLIK